MKTVVTVDLDYWTNHYGHVQNSAFKLLDKLQKAASYSFLIWSHHRILDVLPPGTERIINIDYHTDITTEQNLRKKDLNEGTWGNLLPSSVHTFDWFHPSKHDCVVGKAGLCTDWKGNVSLNPKDYPIDRVSFTQGFHNMKAGSIHTFVLCVSPNWANCHDFRPYLEYLGIGKGRRTKITRF